MSLHLTTEADFADMLGKPEAWVAERRRRKGWPHVRLGRFDIRYTDRHIEQIIAECEVKPAAKVQATSFGQTQRSQRRSA